MTPTAGITKKPKSNYMNVTASLFDKGRKTHKMTVTASDRTVIRRFFTITRERREPMAHFIEIHGLDDEDVKLLEILAERLKKKAKSKRSLPKESSRIVTANDVLAITAGGWKDTVDCEELKRRIYEDRLYSTRSEIRL